MGIPCVSVRPRLTATLSDVGFTMAMELVIWSTGPIFTGIAAVVLWSPGGVVADTDPNFVKLLRVSVAIRPTEPPDREVITANPVRTTLLVWPNADIALKAIATHKMAV